MSTRIQFSNAETLAQAIVDTIRDVRNEERSDVDIVADLAQKIKECIESQYELDCDCC